MNCWGKFELSLKLEDAKSGSHPGDCGDDIDSLRKVPYIAEQLEKISREDAIDFLSEFVAWSNEELSDHELNLGRILWIACGDICDGP
jgi:hypothetical protein